MTGRGDGGIRVGTAPKAVAKVGPVAHVKVRRYDADGGRRIVMDAVAAEEPLEIRLETRSLAVVMRTPGHDEELVAGFLLSEGVIDRASAIRAIRPYARNRDGHVVDAFLADAAGLDWSQLSRNVLASASCGLCGVSSLRAMRRRFPRIRDRFVVDAAWLRSMPTALRGDQAGFDATGGLHAAALFRSEAGRTGPWVVREDIGRHNAVDKVLGRALLDGALPLRRTVLWVSGRVSFEIVLKALAGGVAVVASVGAPSSLAVDFARANGQTLIGFLRDGRFNVYAGPGRVR